MDSRIESSMKEKLICGIDEVGRGPLAGDVVTCAIIMPNAEEEIIDIVNDSKKLSKKKREKAYDLILEKALAYGIGKASPQEIDQINIKQATRKAMKDALSNMIENYNIKPEIVLIDFESIDTCLPQKSLIKGDAISYNIACASIVAKVTRDREFEKFEEIYPGYSFSKNVGYGTKAHTEAIKKLGITPIHRKTFLKKLLGSNNE